METPEQAPHQHNEAADNERLQYECEQALLRMRYGQPSTDEAWEQLETRMNATVATARKRRLRKRLAWAACVGTAAVAALLWLFRTAGQGDCPECDHIVLCEAQPDTSVVVSERSADAEADRPTVVSAKMPVRKQGAVISRQQADYTQAAGDRVRTCVVTIPRGYVYRIILSDSTQVWMNADSRLSFPSRFTGATREVQLEGEAYFRVAKDASRPFVIHTHNATTEVLGTEFNLRAYPDADACLTLIEGSVRVELPPAIGREVVLHPGQDVVYGDSTYEVRKADIRRSSRWKDGFLYFDNTYLVDILNELGRRYNLTVEIEDDPKLMYTCLHLVVDRHETIDNIIENLNMFEYLSVTKNGEKITIRRK